MLQDYAKTTIYETTPNPLNLRMGTYVQRILPTHTVQLLVEKKPPEIKLWAAYKFYKTT